ncbi:MAG: type II toxin-antitoxin system PemK/MazF family toxin [Moorellaceae bacterium]
MTSYSPGDVVLVPFPFSDLRGAKKRPALVLAIIDHRRELVCVMLTSSPYGWNEVPVRHWKEAGLLKPTVARVHRLFTLETALVLEKQGSVDLEDFREVLAGVVATLVRGRL